MGDDTRYRKPAEGAYRMHLDWAKARGYRSGENPARWKGHLNQLLPALAKKHRVTHHKAMPFSEVAAFVSRLRESPTISARCLEFTIVTAARTNEAIQAKPEEFDLTNAIWTIPASRMKAKKAHRVPLSARAVEVVRELLTLEKEFVFPGTRRGEPISNMAMLSLLDRMDVNVTVHGSALPSGIGRQSARRLLTKFAKWPSLTRSRTRRKPPTGGAISSKSVPA